MAHKEERFVKNYDGSQECHARIGDSGSTRCFGKCHESAKHNANGRLLCDEHWNKYFKKYKNKLREYLDPDNKIPPIPKKECMKAYGGLGSEWDTGIAGHLDNLL